MVSIKGFLDRTENKQTKSIPSSWDKSEEGNIGRKKSSDERIPLSSFIPVY